MQKQEAIELGELYHRYWRRWLRKLQVKLAKVGQLHESELEVDPVAFVNHYPDFGHPGTLFKEAFRQSLEPEFEPVSFALLASKSPSSFIERWHTIMALQNRRLKDEIMIYEGKRFILNPRASVQASGGRVGSLVLAAATMGLLVRWGWGVERVVQLLPSGKGITIFQEGKLFNHEIVEEPDSIWVYHGNAQNIGSPVSVRETMDLGFLSGTSAGRPLISELSCVWHLLKLDITHCDRHLTLADLAQYMGKSERSLSRNLSRHQISWRDLVRVFRFREASSLIVSGKDCQDEVAFESGYSDRHHMARDYRRLSALSPGEFKEVINI